MWVIFSSDDILLHVIFPYTLICLFKFHIDMKWKNWKLCELFFHKEKRYLKFFLSPSILQRQFFKIKWFACSMFFINDIFIHNLCLTPDSYLSSYMKSTSLLDSHFSIFIEAFAVYKIKQKHCSSGGNAACSFRKSEWEKEANITFPGYLPESNFTSHQHFERGN